MMRSNRKKWIIIAVVLAVVGLLTAFSAMAALDFDFMKLSGESYESSSYTVEEQFGNISVKSDISDINIVKSNDGECRIDVNSSSRYEFSYSVEGKTLNIEHIDDREWYEYIGIFDFGRDLSITLYLPEYAYGNLHIESSTGEITSDSVLCFDSVSIEASTADISFSSSVKGAFECEVSTGDIWLQNTSFGSLSLMTSTGEVNIKSVDTEGVCRITTDTGEATLSAFDAGELYIDVNTGEIELNDTVVEGLMKLTSSTGNVTFNESDAATINVNTSTGNVSGVLLTSKIFYTESSTGKINVPKSNKGGICEIKTSTGDIVLSVKNS